MLLPGPTRCPDWLVIGQERWDEVERRNHFLIRALAERHPYARFLFSEIPLRVRNAREWRSPRARQVAPNIWVVRPVRALPGARGDSYSDRLECLQLRRALRSIGIESAALWTQDPRAACLLAGLPVNSIVYDYSDDWAAFEVDPARRARLEAQIEQLASRAKLVLASSRTRQAAASRWGNGRVLCLPNPVDPCDTSHLEEHFAPELEAALGVERARAAEPGITAVVVSYNTRALLERCLSSLRSQTDLPLQTIVVDNGSTDGSVELVRNGFPEVELLELGENAGFARANNIGFGRCRSEYVLLLNSDAFLAPGALAALVAAARRHPRAGVVGPRLLNSDGTVQRSAWPFPHAGRQLLEAVGAHRILRRLGLIEDLGTWAHNDERNVDFLIGACLLVRGDALAEAGGFDERFWLYGEEADLQRRLAARGWEVVFTPAAVATHVGGASSPTSVVRLRGLYAGQREFFRKHGTPLSWPIARLALLIAAVLRGRWEGARVAMERQPGPTRGVNAVVERGKYDERPG